MNIPGHRSVIKLMWDVSDLYGVDIEQAHYAVTSAAREMGYVRPLRDGIWIKDAFSLLRIVDRKLS